MVEGGFLNKGKSSLSLEDHGIVLRQAEGDVIIDKVLSNCKADLQSGDTILSLNGISVSKAVLVHKALAETEAASVLEVSRGSGPVQEVYSIDVPAPPSKKAPLAIVPDTKEPLSPPVVDATKDSSAHQQQQQQQQKDAAGNEGDAASKTEQEGEAIPLCAADAAKEAGNKAFKSGDMILAVEHFTEAIRLNPTDFTYFSNRSASLLQLGKLADAEADARECLKIKPQLAKGHFRLSQALLASGKDGEAVEALRSACKLEPLNAQLRGQLTRAERKLQQQQQQQQQQAKHVPPSSQEATTSAEPPSQQQQQQQQPSKEGKSASSAKDAWSSGDAELAAKAYERASKWADNGENMRAAEGFTEAINLAPSNPSYYAARSHVLLKASRFDDALEDACKSLTLRPGNPLGTVRKGQALAMLGRMDLAIDTLEAGVEAHPDDAQLKNALGEIRVIAGRMAGVLSGKSDLMSNFDEEMVINCEVPKQSRGGDNMSVTVNVPAFGPVKCQVRVPADKKGGDDFTVSLGSKEDLAERKKDEANSAYKTGRMQKAAEDYTVAIGLNPGCHAYHANRSAAHYTMGKFQEALEDAEACLKLRPGFGRALFRKGQALAGMCKFVDAVDAFQSALGGGEGGSGVEEALARAKEDLERQREGKELSSQEREEDAREKSEYVIHRAQLEVERGLETHWHEEQAKKKQVEALRIERAAANVTSSALEGEIAAAKWHDKSKADIERSKFQAVAQRVEYDQFEQMVAGASLNAMKTRSNSNEAGIIVAGGSGGAVEGGLAAKVVNMYGEGRKKKWLPGFEGVEDGDTSVELPKQLLSKAGEAGPPKTLKEFDVAWRKAKGDGKGRYSILRGMPAESLKGVFKTEMDSETLCEMLSVMAGPDGCTSSGLDDDLQHALEVMDSLRSLPRFELNLRFLGSKDRAHASAVVSACGAVQGLSNSHGSTISQVKKSFQL